MQPAMPEGTVYTCPMHPQVRRVGPGFCPICGMALEPLLPAKTDDDGAIRNVRRRFWVSIVLAVPVVLLAMVPHLFNLTLTHTVAHSLRIAEFALTAPIVLWAAFDYYRRGWSGVMNRTPNMYTLIGLGVLVAFVYSVFATLAPETFPLELRDAHGMVGVYFEVAAVIVVLVLLGEWLELGARGRTSAAIRQLLELAPKIARRILADGTEEEVPLDSLLPGDRVRVRPGEKCRRTVA